jgi:hypothetical protein
MFHVKLTDALGRDQRRILSYLGRWSTYQYKVGQDMELEEYAASVANFFSTWGILGMTLLRSNEHPLSKRVRCGHGDRV